MFHFNRYLVHELIEILELYLTPKATPTPPPPPPARESFRERLFRFTTYKLQRFISSYILTHMEFPFSVTTVRFLNFSENYTDKFIQIAYTATASIDKNKTKLKKSFKWQLVFVPKFVCFLFFCFFFFFLSSDFTDLFLLLMLIFFLLGFGLLFVHYETERTSDQNEPVCRIFSFFLNYLLTFEIFQTTLFSYPVNCCRWGTFPLGTPRVKELSQCFP